VKNFFLGKNGIWNLLWFVPTMAASILAWVVAILVVIVTLGPIMVLAAPGMVWANVRGYHNPADYPRRWVTIPWNLYVKGHHILCIKKM